MSSVGQDRRVRGARWVVVAGLLLALLLALAACSANQNGSSSGKPKACGTIHIQGAGQVADAAGAQQTENCFWQAYQQCQGATMIVTTMGIDTSVNRTFTVVPNGGSCKVSDAEQNFSPPNHTGPLNIYSCANVQQVSGGLLFHSCGADGDVQVPPQPSNS